MRFFGVRYWTFLFWINVVLSVAHAFKGSNMMFLSIGMAVVCSLMAHIVGTEN